MGQTLSRERVKGPREKPLTVDTIVCTGDSQYLIKRSLPHRISSFFSVLFSRVSTCRLSASIQGNETPEPQRVELLLEASQLDPQVAKLLAALFRTTGNRNMRLGISFQCPVRPVGQFADLAADPGRVRPGAGLIGASRQIARG